jgi:hypothetical protein
MANNLYNKQVSPKGYKRGGPVKQNKKSASPETMKSKELKTYNKMRDLFEKQNKSEQRKKDMEKDKQKLYEQKYGVAVKNGGLIKKRTQKAVGGIAVKLGKEGLKYLKNNPDKVKKIMDSPLPKKTKNLLSKMKKTFEKKK